MNRIDNFFETGRKAFIPYITAGCPTVDDTVGIMHLLVEQGADIIELGYPFSDPTADGPVIQAASQAALTAGFTRQDYLDILRSFRERDADTPVVTFGYYNPVFRRGVREFAAAVKEAGADALLVVDLPMEEQGELRSVLDDLGMHLIQLVAPTTPDGRVAQILKRATGFVYQISRRGVTGVQGDLAVDAEALVQRAKALTSLPVVLGFGIADGAQAGKVARAADGVVAGSVIMQTIQDNGPDWSAPLGEKAKELADAIHGAG